MHLDAWSIQGNGFHFGVHGLGEEETALAFPSDSLFAALVARRAASGGSGAVQRFMAPFLRDEPPFALTSTFPSAGALRFFPPPLDGAHPSAGRTAPAAESVAPHAKALKRVRFISEALFRRCLAGASLAGLYPSTIQLQFGGVLLDPSEVAQLPPAVQANDGRIWQVERRPRVTVGRSAANSTIYFSGRVSFAAGCGLWFGVHRLDNDPAHKAELASLLDDLGESGLGGKRSVGFGACRFADQGGLDLPDASGRPWVSLSRYLPRSDEMSALADPRSAYTLRSVGGRLNAPQSHGFRRRPVALLAEGSVFGPLERPVPGRIEDVRPSFTTDRDPLGHAVYRCGLAVAVGLEGASA